MQKRAAENICITSTALYWSENLFLFLFILFSPPYSVVRFFLAV